MPYKIVVILSGGMDSSVLLFDALKKGHEVSALTIDYGQRHKKEIEAARKITEWVMPGPTGWGSLVAHEVVDLGSALRPIFRGSGSSQVDNIAVPHGHYAEDSMKQTIVPNRNMLLLALAGAWAISKKYDSIAYGAHAGDHAIYPDCRPEFVDALALALLKADWHQVTIVRPFISWTKADIAARGTQLGVPFHLTWSCYEGGDLHCGECGTCVERKEAFRDAKVYDPTDYINSEGVSSVRRTA